MMTFFSAVGTYRLRTEDGRKVPYIQKLGKLHPISIMEFVIWTTLLWEVMTYQELRDSYEQQVKELGINAPDFDVLLDNLVARKLIVRGVGYTGVDALYNMLADAFVVPCGMSRCRKAIAAARLCLKGKISLKDCARAFKTDTWTVDEERIYDLILQTPLSTSELIRCFDRNLCDVSTPEKVLNGLYPDEDSDQAHIANEEFCSKHTNAVLQAVSHLYLNRNVILEYA